MRAERRALTLLLLLLALALSAAEPLYHVLAKGETLYALARKYKIPYEALAAANSIKDPDKIKVGQKLLIPSLHLVAKGETLYGIARGYGVSVEEIRKLNALSAAALIKPGDALLLPASARAPVPATGGSRAAPSGEQAPPKQAAEPPKKEGQGGSGAIPLPPPVKTSARAVDPSLSWPSEGEARYLDGKLFGVMIRTGAGAVSKAVMGGTVVSAGPYRGFGEVAFVQSRTGHIYVYGGNESLEVGVGDSIKAGQELGKVGFDAKEGRPIAYFFVFKEGDALDPALAPRN